jgi:hypothetical protein
MRHLFGHFLHDAPRKTRRLPGPETWQPGGVQIASAGYYATVSRNLEWRHFLPSMDYTAVFQTVYKRCHDPLS